MKGRSAAGRAQSLPAENWRTLPFIQLTNDAHIGEGAEGNPLLITESGRHYSLSRNSLPLVQLLQSGCSGERLYSAVSAPEPNEDLKTPDPLGQFLIVLQDGGLLNIAPNEKRARRSRLALAWAGLDLFRRFPLPDKATRRVESWGARIARVPQAVVLSVVLGLPILSAMWGLRSIATPAAFPGPLAVLLLCAILLAQLAVHELLHALAMGYLGLKVRDMGFGLVFYAVPAGYVDRSSAYTLRSRPARAMISLSGPLWDLFCIGMVGAIAAGSQNAEVLMILTWVNYFQIYTLIVNLNPLFRTDGYYALESLFGSVNMRTRAFMYVSLVLTRRQLPAHLRTVDRRARSIYWLYATICSIYLVFISGAIATAAIALMDLVVS